MTKKIYSIFDFAFGIRPEEFKIVNLFLLYLTILYTGYTVISTAALSLFLGRIDSATLHQLLPWLYIAIAVVVTFIAKIYQKFIDKFSRIKLIISTTVFFIVSFFTLRLLTEINFDKTLVYALLMIWDETSCVILIMVFYSFLGDYFHVHSARRLYAYITGGMALGAPIGGFGSAFLLNYISTPNLIYIGISLHALALLFAYSIYKNNLVTKENFREKKIKAPLFPRKLLFNKYLLFVFLVGSFPIICACIDSYQMFYVASKTLNEKELGSFMGKFYGSAGLMLLVIDFLLAKWFRNRNVFTNLLIMPVLLVFTCIAFIFNPILIFAASIKFVDNVLTNTVNTFAFQVLFLPLTERIRMHAQAMSAGLMTSGAKILGGIILVIFSYFYIPIQFYTIVILMITIVWISCIFLLIPLYKKELAASTSKLNLRSIDFETIINDPGAHEVIENILNSHDKNIIVTFLKTLQAESFQQYKNSIEKLLVHPEPVIAIEALNTYGMYGDFKRVTQISSAVNSQKSLTHCLYEIDTCHSFVSMVSAYHALRQISDDSFLDEKQEVQIAREKIYQKLIILRQAYQEMRILSPFIKQLFIDSIYFYTSILCALLSIEFHTKELIQLKDLIYANNENNIHSLLELLETVVPNRIIKDFKKILVPVTQITFTQDQLSERTTKNLLAMDPWINSLTIYVTQGAETMKAKNPVYFEYIETILFLKQVNLFKEVPVNFLAPIAEVIYEQHYLPGDCIFKQEENSYSLFIIKSGAVKIQTDTKEIIILKVGESFGELALLENLPHSASAYCVEKTTVYRLNSDEFIKILDMYPEVSRALLKILAHRLRVIALDLKD